MKPYDHKKIEPKWQKEWDKKKAFVASDTSKKPKWYSLIEFPYPSGDGLHVGHIRSNTAMDIISRKRRREGYNVLYPIGWDAFGLPTENYAIKTGIQPAVVTKKNTAIFRKQLKSLGFSFDWSREINTTDPNYYKWTQWIFLQFLKNGLAYKKKMAINWCPKDLIGLANEEVVDGKCERCGTPVEKREKEQWMLAITKYADRLDKDLDLVNYLPEIKAQQRNWIGKSEGAEISFELKSPQKLKYILLHGFRGSAKGSFRAWLKSELESRGHEVEIPELPNTEDPRESEQVEYVLQNCKIDENTVIVAHSLGSVVAMKALMKLNKPIFGLVLVSPAIDPSFPKAESRPYWKNFTWNIDYDLIRRLANGKISILSDLKEEFRIEYIRHLSNNLKARLIETKSNGEHFRADQEPEILKAVVPSITVFTTRPDTLFGVTYLVLAPEHPLVRDFLPLIKNRSEALIYITRTKKESDIERTDATREKMGVELKGVKAINPVNGEEVPVYIADYVLADYGTGAVMAVPAHDDRDLAFAKKYDLPIKEAIMPCIVDHVNPPRADKPSKIRTNVHAIVFDPLKKKYLIIRNDKHGWDTVVIGGVEAGEDFVEAAKREVREETGYTDIEFKKKLGSPVRAEYFAKHKDENRIAIATGLYFELKSDARVPITDENGEGNQILWIDPADFIPGKMVNSELPLWLARLHSETDIAFIGEGLLINSGSFNDKKSAEIRKEITAYACGQWVNRFKLRDWIFSRQRYWGEPIPVVHCEKCGIVPVPEKDLPVKLPPVKNYKPTETGESPLAAISKWVNVKCPKCKGKAKRETDTMPNWAGSSWYYLRYTDPKNATKFADMKKLKHWTPVDWYNGGMEHVTLHLLYSRFWHKFLFDQGLVPTSEPYIKAHLRTVSSSVPAEKRCRNPAAMSSIPTQSSKTSAPIHCASTRCSWVRSIRRSVGTRTASSAVAVSLNVCGNCKKNAKLKMQNSKMKTQSSSPLSTKRSKKSPRTSNQCASTPPSRLS